MFMYQKIVATILKFCYCLTEKLKTISNKFGVQYLYLFFGHSKANQWNSSCFFATLTSLSDREQGSCIKRFFVKEKSNMVEKHATHAFTNQVFHLNSFSRSKKNLNFGTDIRIRRHNSNFYNFERPMDFYNHYLCSSHQF